MNKKTVKYMLIALICFVFIDIVSAETYNNFENVNPVSCGNGLITKVPAMVPNVISTIYTIIQIAVPIVLVIMGSMDLIKGIMAQKDDDIKKGQQIFIKRLISAALVFLVFLVVKLIISLVATDDKDSNKAINIMDCAECFINNECD